MQSLFKKKKSKDSADALLAPPAPPKGGGIGGGIGNSNNGFGVGENSSSTSRKKKASNLLPSRPLPVVDEHGRSPPPSASALNTSTPVYRTVSNTSNNLVAGHGANPHTESIIDPDVEIQLLYGYWRIEAERELGLDAVDDIIRHCGEEIKLRGLDRPLLFSTHALDIDLDATCDLIRQYFADYDAWLNDLQYANPHNLAAMIKWSLGRIMNAQSARGFLPWDMYERWKFGERERGFNKRYITTHLLYHLPTQTANILTSLLQLMSSTAAYSSKNGNTPRSLAARFSSFIFGLPDDKSFDTTYNAFIRFTHATEHLLLAYIRDQKDSSGSIPTKLEEFIANYPECIPGDMNQPPSTANLRRVARIRRNVRFYSKNLIHQATEIDVPNSPSWNLIYPTNSPNRGILNDSNRPLYTSKYRHLLNIRASDNDTDDLDQALQKYKNVFEKDWFNFKEIGFSAPDEKKLMFDLTESERNSRKQKHATMDWNTFQNIGFGRESTSLDQNLNFDPQFSESVKNWPQERQEINNRIRKTEKCLPEFPFDITPYEEPTIKVDELFFEVWADVLVSSGWSKEEMKESCWAFLQLRARPANNNSNGNGVHGAQQVLEKGSQDLRTDEKWFLIEEFVPSEYREELAETRAKNNKANKRTSFLRSVRRKGKKDKDHNNSVASSNVPLTLTTSYSSSAIPDSGQLLQATSSNNTSYTTATPKVVPLSSFTKSKSARHLDHSVFEAGSRGPTTKLTMTNDNRNTTYSQSTSVNAPTENDSSQPKSAPPNSSFMGYGIGGTLSSQQPPTSPVNRSPVGFNPTNMSSAQQQQNPSSFGGNIMATIRKKTMRKATNDSNNNNNSTNTPASLAESDEFDYATRSIDSLPTPYDKPPKSSMGNANERRASRDDAWVDVLVKSNKSRLNGQDYDASKRGGVMLNNESPVQNTRPRSSSDSANANANNKVTPPPRLGSRPLSKNNKINDEVDENDFQPISPPTKNNDNYNRQSSSVTSNYENDGEDPYDGIADAYDRNGEEEHEEGQPAWRGSQVYTSNNGNNGLPTPPSSSGKNNHKLGINVAASNMHGKMYNRDTLPPSPKPEADVPQDERSTTTTRSSSTRYRVPSNNTSNHNDSKVGQLIEVYEETDAKARGDENLRLSNFGFPSNQQQQQQ